MSDTDRFLETIEAVYASGVDDSCWPQALKLTTNLFGGVGTFLEVVDKAARQYNVFCTASTLTDTSARSFKHFAKLAPRMPSNPCLLYTSDAADE